jgi:PAS domain S-box-containing protein
MDKEKKDLHKYKILVILASVFLILLFDHLGLFEGINYHLYDLSFRLRGSRPPLKDILLIEIHEETLKKMGQWPIRRLHYSSLLERLKEAEVVVLDITLSEPTGDDALLAGSIERHGRVILPVYIDNRMNLVSPASTLRAFYRAGHVHLEGGVDGIVRDGYHTLVHQKLVIPSISSVAYEAVSKTSFQRTSAPPSGESGKEIIQMDPMRINYCGPPGTFEQVFFSDVLHGVYRPAFFKGKIILVGVAAIGLGDQFLTPFSQNRNYMPGVEVQANILNTLLANNSIRVTSPWVLWPFVLLLSLLSYLFFLKVPEKKAMVFGLAILVGMATTLYVLFSAHQIWFRPVVLFAAIVVVFFVTYVMKLGDAAKNLDRAYAEMQPRLRWRKKAVEAQVRGNGVSGVLTPGGVQSKVQMLADVSHQLIFEKELTDRALLNHLHAVLLFGPDGKNVIVNELAASYCEANSLDRTTAEGFLKGIRPHSIDGSPLGVPGPGQHHVTSMISLPLPQKRYMKIDASFIDGLDGNYLLFTLSDVTVIQELEILKDHLLVQKRAEEALKKSENMLAGAQRIAHLGSWDWDIGTGDLHWSEEGYRILGLLPQGSGATYEAFLAAVHPDDRRAVQQAVKESLSDPERTYSIEYRVIRPDGSERFVHARGEVLFDQDRRPVRMMGTVHDITERKRGEEALKRALEEIKELKLQLEAENIYLREEVKLKDGPRDIVGVSNPLKYVFHRIQQVARTGATVLLTGETGTGKGLFARSLHEASDRRDKPFINVNCAGLPANLIESELFGREKGAFTGATARQIGRFELANGGTIFLDEIGEFPFELQAKLLKVIENGEFERLGSPRTVKVDVRIIASTNRHLEEEIKKGRFREDLFYRLNVFPITIPPLRERREDIPLLVKFYADGFNKRHGKGIRKIPTNTMKVLENYSWPGNVRELINVIERAVIVSTGPELRLAAKIDTPLLSPVQENQSMATAVQETKGLEQVEREHILRTLQETGWKIEGPKGAAQLLGMNPSTMRARMRKLGIKRPGPDRPLP